MTRHLPTFAKGLCMGSIQMNTKTCIRCKAVFPATSDFFHVRRENGRETLRGECKKCQNKRQKEWEKLHGKPYKRAPKPYPERRKQRNDLLELTCVDCGKVLPFTIEFFGSDGKCNKQGEKILDSHCRECDRKRRKTYRTANPDKVKAQKQRSHIRNKAANSARHARWQKENWEKVAPRIHAHVHKRRALMENGGSYTQDELDNQRNIQNGCCYYCGVKPEGKLHIDHYIPLTKGGSNCITNIVLACRGCNSSKGAKFPHVWRDDLPPTKP